METLLSSIEWAPVLVSTVVAFMTGWAWYSPALFVKPWLAGLPKPPVWQAPMWMPMAAQLGSTLLLAIIINLAHSGGEFIYAALVTITLMGFTKANGFYAGKNKTAISVEVLYILVMAILIWGVNLLM